MSATRTAFGWLSVIIISAAGTFWYYCDPIFRSTGLLAEACAWALACLAVYAFVRLLYLVVFALRQLED